ncbi:hypothetical protein [Clostridium carboxidivorans]|nr:hypothetical protein [Clostridium carboxidivorans]
MVNVLINKIPIDKAISSVLSGVIVLLICEWINLFILNDYLKVNIQVMEDNPMMRTLYMMPSLILFVCFISLLYLWLKIKKRNKDVFN